MTASAAMLTHTWPVGSRFKVTLTVPPVERGAAVCASAVWDPHFPTSLTPEEQDDYDRGMDEASRRLAAMLEGSA